MEHQKLSTEKCDSNVSTCSESNWNLEVLVFVGGGRKTGESNPEKHPLEQGREATKNSTHMWTHAEDQT